MEFDDAKENIQPLATGRNASILQASITHTNDLIEQRREMEAAIHNYSGDDPLEPWYNYIDWIEQSCPTGGKESGLMEVLGKCLRRFESEERYYQDRRMIKLFIKFLDGRKDGFESYQQLFNAGIGTMVADFYIAWAYCFDSAGQMHKSDEIFRRGIQCRAQPLEELREAHQHFCFSIGQRTLHKDNEDVLQDTNRQIEERRSALSSLRGYRGRKAEVGSIRTGSAIKSFKPGTINNENNETSSATNSRNVRISVLADENANPYSLPVINMEEMEKPEGSEGACAVRSIVDKARHQENQIEPGPWNKTCNKSNQRKKVLRQNAVIGHDLGFSIHEDMEDESSNIITEGNEIPFEIKIPPNEHYYDMPFKYSSSFVSKNNRQPEWILPITTECEPEPKTIPHYNKLMTYPRPNREFQTEEVCAYLRFKKQGIKNSFTERYNAVWSVHDISAPVRRYPNFARTSKPQMLTEIDEFYVPSKGNGVVLVPLKLIYDVEKGEEFQNEEFLLSRRRYNQNETIIETEDMDETMCTSSNNEHIQRRKSFFPMRRSLAIRSVLSAATENDIPPTELPKQESDLLRKEEKKEEKEKLSLAEKSSSTPSSKLTFLQESVKPDNNCDTNLASSNDFQFKTPALPPMSIKQQVRETSEASASILTPGATSSQSNGINKLPFEIYVEENTANHLSPTNPSVGVFEPEETFSTQMFNNFISAQSVSTPKNAEKLPKRQFGVLRDVVTPAAAAVSTALSMSPKSENVLPPINDENRSPPNAVNNVVHAEGLTSQLPPVVASDGTYSMLGRKQLSTILETSEHCTTQGTHSTGASSKSGTGSQESEVDDMAIQRVESKEIMNPQNKQNFENNLSAVAMTAKETTDLFKHVQVESPPTSRLQAEEEIASKYGSPKSALKFSIFMDPTETVPKLNSKSNENLAGGFDRLVQREDSVVELGYTAQSNVRFQDDKTETLTKITYPCTFPDDKTETIPKIHNSLFAFAHQSQTPICAPSLSRLEVSNRPNISTLTKSLKNVCIENENADYTFEFFCKSPPKPVAEKANYANLNRKETEMVSLSELSSKQHWTKDSPKMVKLTTSTEEKDSSKLEFLRMFEDELLDDTRKTSSTFKEVTRSQISQSCTQQPNIHIEKSVKEHFNNSRPCSIFSEFSCIRETQPNLERTAVIPESSKKVPQKNLLDSLFLDCSADSQLKTDSDRRQKETSKIMSKNSFEGHSLLTDFSLVSKHQTHPETMKTTFRQTRANETAKNNQSLLHRREQTQNSMTELSLLSEAAKLSLNREDFHRSDFKIFEMPQQKTVTESKKCDSFLQDFSLIEASQLKISTAPNDNVNLKLTTNSQDNKVSLFLPDLSVIEGTQPDSSKISVVKESQPFGNFKTVKIDQQNSMLPEFSIVEEEKAIRNASVGQSQILTQNSLTFKNTSKTNQAGNENKSNNFSFVPESQDKSLLPQPLTKNSPIHNKETNLPFLTRATETETPMELLFFEMNDKTVEFSAGLAMVKNSTMFSHSQQDLIPQKFCQSQIQEQSIHIKEEKSDTLVSAMSTNFKLEIEDKDEMSIYVNHTPHSPVLRIHNNTWSDDDGEISADNNYLQQDIDPNQTAQLIHTICIDPNVNPFNGDLLNAFLDEINFVNYLKDLKNTMLVGKIPCMKVNSTFTINGLQFKVTNLIGEGAYGIIYCGVETKSGTKYALKQERPPNYWEYYICLEVQSRIHNDDMLSAYMNIDYALIGNNASLFVSKYSRFGSIIEVCNKIKKRTYHNVDEYVVMFLTCELLEIIDHLHAANIIHADIKADNFLLMRELQYNSKQPSLQLIDFGVSIDFKRFNPTQTFTYVNKENAFKCVEMREGRPWRFQLDLYGLAGVIHVMLFGKYMEIEKRNMTNTWMPRIQMPRYINKLLWENIFKTLLNIRDCNSMPNLQNLRSMIKEEIAEKERYVIDKIKNFNNALLS